MNDAARDSRRRIDEVYRPSGNLLQALGQQRVMGTGEDDGVGLAAVVSKAGGNLGAQSGIADRPTVQLGLGIGREFVGAYEIDRAALRVVANECAGIFAFHSCLSAKHGDAPRAGGSTSRLYRRHRADE